MNSYSAVLLFPFKIITYHLTLRVWFFTTVLSWIVFNREHLGKKVWNIYFVLHSKSMWPLNIEWDSSFLSVAVTNTITNSDFGEKTGYSLSLRAVRAGTWRQKLCRMVFADLLIGLCLAIFLTQPRSTCLGMVPPTVAWVLLHQLTVRKMPHRQGHRPIQPRQFFY